jgi:hypothetical protein
MEVTTAVSTSIMRSQSTSGAFKERERELSIIIFVFVQSVNSNKKATIHREFYY